MNEVVDAVAPYFRYRTAVESLNTERPSACRFSVNSATDVADAETLAAVPVFKFRPYVITDKTAEFHLPFRL